MICLVLQPQNVLVNQGKAKLADFAMSSGVVVRASMKITASTAGTDAYSAPEVVADGRASLSAASDMYSFGMLMYHMIEEEIPWSGESSTFIARKVQNGERPRFLASDWTPELMELTTVCYVKEFNVVLN